MLTQEYLKSILHYEPETGIFTNKISRGSSKKGREVGSKHSEGYLTICIKRKHYYCHRLAWLYVYGCIPKFIDHLNSVRDDNRIANLRSCSRADNQRNVKFRSNNTSGVTGVCIHSQAGKWRAYITLNGKQKSLGLFSCMDDAIKARENALLNTPEFHKNHGVKK